MPGARNNVLVRVIRTDALPDGVQFVGIHAIIVGGRVQGAAGLAVSAVGAFKIDEASGEADGGWVCHNNAKNSLLHCEFSANAPRMALVTICACRF